MNRIKAAVAVVILAAAFAVPATADVPAPAEQTVSGRIVAPVPSNVTGIPRRAFLASRATNGLIGHAFDVDPATIGGPFDLTATADPTGSGDLNIVFYSNTGTVGTDAPTSAGDFYSEGVGGERGIVPVDSQVAMVFISGGANVSFAYTATPPPVVTLATDAPLDVEVRTGGTLRFTNALADAAFVRHTPTSGKVLFDTTLEPGASFDAVLLRSGEYTYESSAGNGVITVVD